MKYFIWQSIPVQHHATIKYVFYCLNVFFAAYFIFYFLKNFPFSTDYKRTMLLVFALIVGASIKFSYVSFDDFSKAIKIVTRAIIGLFLFYVLTAYPSILPVNRDQNLILIIFSIMSWVCVFLGFVGIWRPTLAIPLLMFMVWQREFTFAFFEQQLSYTDNLVVSELGLILILGMAVLALFRQLTNISDPRIAFAKSDDDLVWKMPSPSEVLLLITIAIHFTNYFNSGVKKLILGPEWWSWTLDSPTQEIILAAKLQGMLPISHIDWLWTSVYELFSQNVVFFNFMTILIQLIAVVAVFRIRWMILLTLLYDLSHIIIYFVSGIFFWKWIVFNFAIVAGLSTMREKKLTGTFSTVLFLFITVGGGLMLIFPTLNSTVQLGWYDTSAATVSEIYAVTDEKKRYRIPSNYFLRSSVVIAQDQFENASRINLGYPTFSQTVFHNVMEKASNCSLEPVRIPKEIYYDDRKKLTKYLNRHQQYILSIVDEDGYINYDLYPHHIWSNPFELSDFKLLDKRSIIGFDVVFRSICMKYYDKKIETIEIAKDSFYVPYVEVQSIL